MNIESNIDEFHQEKKVQLVLDKPIKSGELNRVFRELGLYLHYDIYSMDRKEEGLLWQSTSYMIVEMFSNKIKVDAQEHCDELVFIYPLATIETTYIGKFVNLINEIQNKLNGELFYNESKIESFKLVDIFTEFVTELMEKYGEEPGSKELSIMIETNTGGY